jgi:Protein of unknown function (DUF2934)
MAHTTKARREPPSDEFTTDKPVGNPSQNDRGESRMTRIARRAHEIYKARGGEHGRDLDDWLRAERDIDSEIDDEQTR